MKTPTQPHKANPRAEWFKQYIIGLGIGATAALYGLVAMVMGKTFLPSLHGGSHTVRNFSGTVLAAVYLLGGAYLLMRYFLEKRMPPEEAHERLYIWEDLVLVGLIAAMIYVLLHVGEVG